MECVNPGSTGREKNSLRLLFLCVLFTANAHAADPIRIGLVAEITGQAAEGGVYTVNGAKLAIKDINKTGGVLGRQVELHVEDSQGSNPGAVLAFTKLFSRKDIPVIVGPIRSTQIQAASPSIAKAGIPVIIGGTDPSLTRVNNRWVFRCRPNDLYSSKVIAEFGVKDLKLKKWAIVHSTARRAARIGGFTDNYSAWTYDAVSLLALAMNNAKSTEPEAVRKALVSIRGHVGTEGSDHFDGSGEGVRGYNVVKNDNGKVVFIKRVDFPASTNSKK